MTSSPHLVLLRGPESTALNHNASQISTAFQTKGWKVTSCLHDSLRLTADGLMANDVHLEDATLIWHLGFGAQASFLDRMQLLTLAPADRLVTTPAALALYHGKATWLNHTTTTYVANDASWLAGQVSADARWVAKPGAGSFGRGVVFLDDLDDTTPEHHFATLTEEGSYALLQRRIDNGADGELRTLIAAGQPIGSYLRRRAGTGELRHNMSLGGHASIASPTDAQQHTITSVSDLLVQRRIGFAAVDLIGESLVEVNIANPGGLGTLRALGDSEVSERLVAALAGWPAG